MKDSRYWLRHPWLIIALDEEPRVQISRNLEKFLTFWNFCTKKQVLSPYAPRHVALTFARGLQIQKTLHFWIFNDTLWFLVHGQEIWVGFESSRGKKHSKNDLTAPILTHRKKSWEIEVLEGKMTSKFRNSTWVGR